MGRGLISDRLGARIRRALVLGVLLLAAAAMGAVFDSTLTMTGWLVAIIGFKLKIELYLISIL